MYDGADLFFVQIIDKLLPLLTGDHILMPYTVRVRPHSGKRYFGIVKPAAVSLRQLPALLRKLLYMREADSQKPCLKLIQPGICYHDLVIIALFASVVAVHFHV